jgi:5-hydroxyisourate hydrolase
MDDKLTTHAIDTMRGEGARGLKVDIRRIRPDPAEFGSVTLDAGGRGVLVRAAELPPGVYELVFHIAVYHRERGVALTEPCFLDEVPVRFGISDAKARYHIPILISPYGYSTYRGG